MKQQTLIVFLIVAVAAPSAFGWGYATHTVVGDDLNAGRGPRNADEIYGASAPDMFNMAFELPVYGPGGLYELTHDHAEWIWAAARPGRERSLAYGFGSHSDVFGADRTAHHDGITYGAGEGYVIAKVDDMRDALAAIGYDLPSLLGPLPDGVEEEVYHDIIEYATDVLTTRIDPYVGARLADAARRRSPRFPALFVRAYEDELEELLGEDYAAVVAAVEEEFRQGLIEYGTLLTQDEEQILATLTLYIAESAADYLAMLGAELPEGFDPVPLIALYVDVAMGLCEEDYAAELEATTEAVGRELRDRGIRTWPHARWNRRPRH